MISNKKLNPVATELFIRGRTRNISLVFITKSCFKVSKERFFMKMPNKREPEQLQ